MFGRSKNKIAAGINISDFSIELLKLDSKKQAEVYARDTLPRGIIEDGKILSKKKLKQALEELFKKADFRPEKVVCSLPESKVFIHYFELDKDLSQDKLKEAVAKKARKTIPLRPEEVCWDFVIFGEDTKKRILYVGVPSDIVQGYVELFNDLDIKLSALDLESVSLARTLKIGEKSQMIVDMGYRTTNISCFTQEGALALSNISRVAGDYFTESIKEKLDLQEKEAERLKREKGLAASDKKLRKVLKKDLKQLAGEIKKAAEFFEKKFDEKIDQINLTGGSALLKGVEEYFESELGKRMQLLDPQQKIKSKNFFKTKKEKRLFSTVFGLALRDFYPEEKRIDFLQALDNNQVRKEEAKKKNKEEKKSGFSFKFPSFLNKKILAVVLFAVGLGLLGFVLYKYLFVGMQKESTPEDTPPSPAATTTQNQKEVSPTTTPTSKERLQSSTSTATSSLSLSESQSGQSNVAVETENYNMIEILDTPADWLNVRSGPGIDYERMTTVDSGEIFEALKKSLKKT